MIKYKVSYTQILHNGSTKKGITTISYDKKSDAKKYADQLNRSNSYKNARVRKA